MTILTASQADIISDIVSHKKAWTDVLMKEHGSQSAPVSAWSRMAQDLEACATNVAAQPSGGIFDATVLYTSWIPDLREAMLARQHFAEADHDGSADCDDGSYWGHEINVLDRVANLSRELIAQADVAAASPAEVSAGPEFS